MVQNLLMFIVGEGGFSCYLDEICKFFMFQLQEEYMFVKWYKEYVDFEVVERLVNLYLWFVVKIVMGY